MSDARELNQIAQAESAAAYEEKAQQKKDQQANINSHVIRIGKRDPATGKHEIIHPGGGITISGNKTSNASVAYGSQVKTLPSSGYGTRDPAVTLGSKNRESKPQPTVETKLKTRKKPPVIPIKVLFSITKDGQEVFFVGGDRDEPQQVWSIPTSRGVYACLENTGARLDDWIFAVQHWDNDILTTTGFFGTGFNVCQVISPTMPQFNWELPNVPSGLVYAGSGVWVSEFIASPAICIAAERINDNITVKEKTDPNYTMATWCRNNGYDFPLGLTSTAGSYSYNIATAIVWNKKLNIFNGRTTVLYSTREDQIFADYIDVIQYGIAPHLKEESLITKFESEKGYGTALISPDRKHVLYRGRFDQFQYNSYSGQFEKSVLLTQGEPTSDSQSKQIVKEIDLITPDGIDNTQGFFYRDPIADWNPRVYTLYHSGKENTTLKCFHIVPTNWFTRMPTLADLEAITRIDPVTGKGGVTVYEFVTLENKPNKLAPKELVDKRIVIDRVKKLGYEEDPTFKMWSLNYYPEKTFE